MIIVAIGPTDPGVNTYPSNTSGGMVNSAANVLGKTVTYLNTAAAINTFFTTDLGTTVKPRMIWIVSNQATNDLTPAAEAALATHGAALNTFQQNGGGILSHVHDYGWLNVLLPGVTISSSCGAPVVLTALGTTSFPTVTNANVDSGPCHATFGGNLGGLGILAIDPANLNVIIGGSAGVTIAPPPATGVPTLSFWGLLLMATLLGIMGSRIRRRKH